MNNLILSRSHYDHLKAHLFPGDGLEALSVCLATQVTHENGIKFLVTDVYNVPHADCDRKSDLLTWSTSLITPILNKAAKEGKSVIKIHSHPRGPRAFSHQDDRSDFGLFPSIFEWCDGNANHCSLVFTEDFIVGRFFDYKNAAHVIDNVWVIGEYLSLFRANGAQKSAQGFDESTYEVFHNINAGVIGCSGTGGWVIELLGRNEVGALFLADPDIQKEKNLNRIVNSKRKLCGMNKAEVAARSVEDMGLVTKVTSTSLPLQHPKTLEQLKSCDVIFGCVDSIFARHLLNKFCAYYMIPYFDIGVHIASDKGSIVSAVSGYDYVYPGGSSLQSRGIFTAEELANETYNLFSPNIFERLKHDGYIRGQAVGRPAVGVINNIAAAHSFEEFQAQVLSYRYDPSDSVASLVYCAKSRETLTKQEKAFSVDPILQKIAGKGDLFFKEQVHLMQDSNPVSELI